MPLFRREKITYRFEPIRILPFTWRQRRRLIRTAAVSAQAYNFPFNLSSKPPARWVEFFQTAWYQQQGGNEIPQIKGQTLTAVSTLADLQNTLSILKLVVTSANEKYGTLVRQRIEAEEAERLEKEVTRTKTEREMGDALHKLKF